MKSIKVQYLFNSGFSIETAEHQFIFDYYKGNVKLSDKKIFVFSSHGHPDHFNPEIFEWQKNKPHIKYILSDDIKHRNGLEDIISLSPYKEIEFDNIIVKTFGSTDLGLSFLLKLEGINIFHAGDLNWWHWWDDTLENNRIMEKNFKAEIQKLKDESIDIAFFPVDPRLREAYSLGGEYFIKEIRPNIFIPMHFGENYRITKQFSNQMKSYLTKIITIKDKGQEIFIDV